ncbi:hypothetical protein FOZ63_026347 [Perkinsus olseni]|uniref:Uncharacterized protein n=1 Tax=Perkinsus olseni TaxID=32597 RepID=A0A7J6QLX7_PEROL|nr:hypothetical protein FOZ63_026347 [Perkinsus olseni]
MLFPAHVEALRLEMVERVWKESTVVGPLPELMCDIMAYIPKPALTLDCPMEEIILDIDKSPDFIFANGDIVYGIFGIYDSSRSLVREGIYPPGETMVLASPTERGEVLAYYCDISARCLYILSKTHTAHSWTLVEYCLKSGHVTRASEVPRVSGIGIGKRGLLIAGEHCFLVVCWHDRVEILHTELSGGSGSFEVIWSTQLTDSASLLKVYLHLVRRVPLTIDVIYPSESSFRSLRLVMLRESSPFIFDSEVATELAGKNRMSRSIVGTNLHLCLGSKDAHCLRDSRGRQESPLFSLREPMKWLTQRSSAADHSGRFYFIIRRPLVTNDGVTRKDRYRLLRAHPYLAN